jgi:AmmeMemoRadiSam system protein A
MPTHDEALTLARYARTCIREALGGPPATAPQGAPFDEPGAAFVSLHGPGGRLQGCIGSLEPHRSLVDDVAKNARAAALHDPRGRSLELDDVDALEVEVTVLGPLEQIVATDEAEARAALRAGTDGVVLAWGGRRATFIPQMWMHFGDAERLLEELKQKAGLPPHFWAPDIVLSRYTAIIAVDPPRVTESRSAEPAWEAEPRRR